MVYIMTWAVIFGLGIGMYVGYTTNPFLGVVAGIGIVVGAYFICKLIYGAGNMAGKALSKKIDESVNKEFAKKYSDDDKKQ